jgi:epoxide hydrolase-like predicted phosphatase
MKPDSLVKRVNKARRFRAMQSSNCTNDDPHAHSQGHSREMPYEICAIVFDIGGVVYDENMWPLHASIAKRHGIDIVTFNRVVRRYWNRATVGRIKGKRFVMHLMHDLNIHDKKVFMRDWIAVREKTMVPIPGVIDLIKRLKKNYRVGSLTNILHMYDPLRWKRGVYDHFEFNVISSRVGMRKPNLNIYRHAIKKINLNPEQIVFIDDLPRNIMPARKIGMHTILFKNTTQLKGELKKLGVQF